MQMKTWRLWFHFLAGCRCRWVAFEKPGFSGELYVLEKGMYANPEDWGAQNFRIASIQPVFHVRNHQHLLITQRLNVIKGASLTTLFVLQDSMGTTKFKVSLVRVQLGINQKWWGVSVSVCCWVAEAVWMCYRSSSTLRSTSRDGWCVWRTARQLWMKTSHPGPVRCWLAGKQPPQACFRESLSFSEYSPVRRSHIEQCLFLFLRNVRN